MIRVSTKTNSHNITESHRRLYFKQYRNTPMARTLALSFCIYFCPVILATYFLIASFIRSCDLAIFERIKGKTLEIFPFVHLANNFKVRNVVSLCPAKDPNRPIHVRTNDDTTYKRPLPVLSFPYPVYIVFPTAPFC